MTPKGDWHLIPAVLPLKDRCSLNFHFWPPGPWDPCYFHLRESVFSRSPPCVLLFPLPLYSLQREQSESNTQDCSYSIQSVPDCTSSLVPFRLLADAQPLPPQLQQISLYYTDLQKKKNISWNLYSASAKKDTILHRPSNAHKSIPRLWKSNWECLLYYYLWCWTLIFFPWLNVSSQWHPDQ